MKKLLFILGVIALFFISPAASYATEASLSCIPSTGTYCQDEVFTVSYVLNTRGFPVFGADVSAGFTYSVLQATSSQSNPITSVTNWSNPATNTIDNALGSIQMYYGSTQPSYTGNTAIGSVSFKAVSTGQGQFYFNFQQQYDDTTPGVSKIYGKKDGTLISNILTDVTNCIYVIDVCTTPVPTSPPAATSAPIPTVTRLPNTGAVEDTIMILGIAAVLLGAGFFLPSFVKNR